MILRPLWQWGAGETPALAVANAVWAHVEAVLAWRVKPMIVRPSRVETGSVFNADAYLDTFRW